MEETCISLPGLPYKNTPDQVAYTIEMYFSQFGRLEKKKKNQCSIIPHPSP